MFNIRQQIKHSSSPQPRFKVIGSQCQRSGNHGWAYQAPGESSKPCDTQKVLAEVSGSQKKTKRRKCGGAVRRGDWWGREMRGQVGKRVIRIHCENGWKCHMTNLIKYSFLKNGEKVLVYRVRLVGLKGTPSIQVTLCLLHAAATANRQESGAFTKEIARKALEETEEALVMSISKPQSLRNRSQLYRCAGWTREPPNVCVSGGGRIGRIAMVGWGASSFEVLGRNS